MDGRKLRPWIIFKAKIQQKAWLEAYPEAHITTSPNRWTDNELGLWWIKRCFKKETAVTQKGEYRILLVDGHASHITTAAIKYCVRKKIILLYLPAHTTHLLQPLDVGVFAPLATAYKNNIHTITRFSAAYSVDKVDFLEQYRLARDVSMTSINIQKAWKASGLLPFNPQLILKDFILPKEALENPLTQSYNITIRPTTLPEAVVSCNGPSGPFETFLTPATTREVQLLMDKVCKQGNQAEAEIILQKVGKSAISAMADSII